MWRARSGSISTAWDKAFRDGQDVSFWEKEIGALGIDLNTPVVIYDNGSCSGRRHDLVDPALLGCRGRAPARLRLGGLAVRRGSLRTVTEPQVEPGRSSSSLNTPAWP